MVKREVTVILLDVGPRMHPHLEHVARAAADFLTSKMLYKPQAEVALTLFGTTGADNALQREYADQGELDQFLHIEERHDVAPPDGGYLQTLFSLPHGDGPSDFFDALAVAAARLSRDDIAPCEKTILVVSNFCQRVEVESELVEQLVTGMQGRGISLHLVELDTPEDEQQYPDDRVHNMSVLADICQELHHTEQVFQSGVDLLGAFRAHEVTTTSYYAGSLTVLGKLQIGVKLSGKTKSERVPGPAQETEAQRDVEGGLPDAVGGGVTRQREWRFVDTDLAAQQQEPIEEGDLARAFVYGKDLVVVGPGEEAEYRLPTERGLLLLGFVDRDVIPRHIYMRDTHVCVADKAKDASGTALAALVAAMARKRKLAVLRFVRNTSATAKPALLVGAPIEATAAAPPHLLINVLPFVEDIRDYKFPSFTKESWRPTAEQSDAARALLSSMDLGEGPLDEQLAPETTPNPMIHRLYYELCRKAVHGSETAVKMEDPLMRRVFQPRLEEMLSAAEAAAAAAAAFPMGAAARASRRAHRLILSVDRPKEDFEEALLKNEDAALEGLAEVIPNVICGNVGESRFDDAAELVDILRGQCVARGEAKVFNDMMKLLRTKLLTMPDKRSFLNKLENREVKLISNKEVEGSTLDEHKVELWHEATQDMLDA